MEDQLITARIKALMIASYTMAAVILAITAAMVAGLFVSNELVDNEKVFGLLGYVMTSVVSAVAGSYATLMGMKGEVQPLEINAAEEPDPVVSQIEQPTLVVSQEVSIVEDNDDDDDDDMAPWEKYRNDLRYDANGDGVVDENDFPDWRNPGA
jgi:stringent starvation protein B